jgi:Domain of unknown function (DUF3846)
METRNLDGASMKRTIAFLVKPMDGTAQRVIVNDYRDIYHWVGADCFDTCRLTQEHDYVYVDDNGLLKQQPANNFFKPATYPDPLAGNGLVMGCDEEGDSCDPSFTWEEFKAKQLIRQCTIIGDKMGILKDFKYLDEILEK